MCKAVTCFPSGIVILLSEVAMALYSEKSVRFGQMWSVAPLSNNQIELKEAVIKQFLPARAS